MKASRFTAVALTAIYAVVLHLARAMAAQTDAVFAKLRMAKKNAGTQLGWKLQISKDELGFDRVTISTDPHDTEADKEMAQGLATKALDGLVGRLPRSPASLPTKPAIGLQEATERFLREASNLKGATLKAYSTAFRRVALPYFGSDKALVDIDQTAFAGFVRHVNALDRAFLTKEGYLVAMMTLRKWWRSQGLVISEWSWRPLVTKDKLPPHEKRRMLSFDQIRSLLHNASRYRRSEPAKFWVTVLPYFFGCRISEIAQLNLRTDFHYDEQNKIYFFRLNELPEESGESDIPTISKSLKGPASWRVIPIHSALCRHGLIEYLERQRAKGYSRPSEAQWKPLRRSTFDSGVKVVTLKWAHSIIRWGGDEFERLARRKEVVREPKQSYFHSTRHTFNTYLASRGASEEERSLLIGHAFGGVNSETYDKLRNDHVYLSSLVEKYLEEYVRILDDVIAGDAQSISPAMDPIKRPRGRPRKQAAPK